MNKVTTESRERDSAVTLFGPGDYCALTNCLQRGSLIVPEQPESLISSGFRA